MSRKKILLFVPDGVGIKNYLYSKTFQNVSASLSLFHNFDNDTISQIEKEVSLDAKIEIPIYLEGIWEKFLRELIHVSRIKYNAKKVNNPIILDFRKRRHKGLKLKLFYTVVTFTANFVVGYRTILNLEKRYDKALRNTKFYNEVCVILKNHNPDSVFCTHQRALKAPAIFAAAMDLGIETTTVIYSWDNIPKARLALKADVYLAWSQYMKEELQVFYPEISSDKIKVTGTPQFEFYKDKSNIIEKDIFFKKYRLDDNKKIICFSGDDALTSPYDPEYLNDIASAIVAVGMDREYQLVFRRCPVDISDRYDWVLKKFPNILIEMPPLWNYNSRIWSAVYPTYEDVKLLVSLAYYGDLVINVGSTMAFDFGMFNKPCIYINYDIEENKDWSVEKVYRYPHFKSMPSQNVVHWIHSKNGILDTIQKALEQPSISKINDWYEIVTGNIEEPSKKIIKEL